MTATERRIQPEH